MPPPSTKTTRVLEIPRCALTVLSGRERGEDVVFDSHAFRIGKSEDNDLVLSDNTVSRAHCEIVRDARGFVLRDLGSTNGTFFDGKPVTESPLRSPGVLTVGKIEIRCRPFQDRVEVHPSSRDEVGGLVGVSPTMRLLFAWIEKVGRSEATVLLEGEAGVGKKTAARAIHAASPRRNGPFLIVDCATLAGTDGESILFGHEQGAFPGATAHRSGAFDEASGGTLLLANVDELTPDLQPALLRAVEQRTIRRLGGREPERIDVRIIGSTRAPIRARVVRGTYREDLATRLAALVFTIPPLRDRPEDVGPIVLATLRDLARTLHRPELHVRTETLRSLELNEWLGNGAELRNLVERQGRAAYERGLTTVGLTVTKSQDDFEFDPAKSYRDTRAHWEGAFEKAYVTWLLNRHSGNISAASRAADMDRKYLHKLARKHGIERPGDEDE